MARIRFCKFCAIFWFSATCFIVVAGLHIREILNNKKIDAQVEIAPVAVASPSQVSVNIRPSQVQLSAKAPTEARGIKETTITLSNDTIPEWNTTSKGMRCVFTYSAGTDATRDEEVDAMTEELGAGQDFTIKFDSRKKCVEEINCFVSLNTENPPDGDYRVKQEVTQRLPEKGCMERAAISLKSETRL